MQKDTSLQSSRPGRGRVPAGTQEKAGWMRRQKRYSCRAKFTLTLVGKSRPRLIGGGCGRGGVRGGPWLALETGKPMLLFGCIGFRARPGGGAWLRNGQNSSVPVTLPPRGLPGGLLRGHVLRDGLIKSSEVQRLGKHELSMSPGFVLHPTSVHEGRHLPAQPSFLWPASCGLFFCPEPRLQRSCMSVLPFEPDDDRHGLA